MGLLWGGEDSRVAWMRQLGFFYGQGLKILGDLMDRQIGNFEKG
jgi:hypothetical protein